MNRITWIAAPATLIIIGFAPASAFGVVNWSNPSGTTPLFTWSGGNENNGFFGDPVAVGNTLVFTPSAFFAANPVNPSITDTLHVDITVRPGQSINDIMIVENGVRTSLGLTTVQGTLHLHDLTVGSTTDITSSLTYGSGAGNPIPWTGSTDASGLTFGAGTVFHLDLTNNLAALIQGQEIHKNGVQIIFTPTPGALAIGGLSALTLGARRRRR